MQGSVERFVGKSFQIGNFSELRPARAGKLRTLPVAGVGLLAPQLLANAGVVDAQVVGPKRARHRGHLGGLERDLGRDPDQRRRMAEEHAGSGP